MNSILLLKRKKFETICGIFVFAILSTILLLSESFELSYAVAGQFVDTQIGSDLDEPTAMEFAPDGRLFVTEQGGKVRIINNGTLLPTPFLTLPVNEVGERGLNGIAFDPNFTINGHVYLYYTTKDLPIHNRISQFTANSTNPDVAVPGNGTQILNLENLNDEYHNGGALHFGNDGKLYVAVGDNHEEDQSQLLTSRLGKILRINPDGSIPSDNPFFETPGAKQEIWALGFRNPFTFAFSDTNKMYINDVGQNDWEEINLGISGKNYGWPNCEGVCFPPNPTYTDPIYTYNHGVGGAAITGGVFYDSNVFPVELDYDGSYFFGDYVKGFIKRLSPDNIVDDQPFGPLLTDFGSPVDLDVGPDGNLYYLSRANGGEVHKIRFVEGENRFPTAIATASPVQGDPPLTVTFNGTLSSDPDIATVFSYLWDFGDGSPETSGAIVQHTYNDSGLYTAILEVDDGDGGTDTVEIPIIVGTPPVGIIQTPLNGTKYNAGNEIFFTGSATDSQDGILADDAFEWTVLFHHNTHTHPFMEFNGVKNGTFVIPNEGETSADVWYRIYLKVTNSLGLSHTSTTDVIPNKSTITVTSSTPGLRVNIDDQPHTTPISFVSVVGRLVSLEGINLQFFDPSSYQFDPLAYQFESWSNGESVNQIIITPPTDFAINANHVVATNDPNIHMQDLTASSGFSTYTGRKINSEYVSPTSQLVGDNISSITLQLKKTLSPTGVAEIGIFNADLSAKKLFATKDVSTFTTSYLNYTFSLPPGQSYQLQSGDRIGIKYTGGSGSANISVMRDTDVLDPFDGTHSFHSYNEGSWKPTSGFTADLYMMLKENLYAPIISSVTPASNSFINGGFSTNYTLSETVSSGTITFTRTGGAADNLTHIYNFVDGDKILGPHSISRATLEAGFGNALVSLAIYNMTISVTDASLNSATIENMSINYDNTGPCIPQAGTWNVVTTCKITTLVNAPGNVIVQNGAIVIIENGGTLNIDLATKYLKIHSGSGILIKSGGKIS